MLNKIKVTLIKGIRFPLDHIPYLRPLLSRLLPESIVLFFSNKLMPGRPDRVYLENTILKYLANKSDYKILFIGSRSYTQHYGLLFNDDSSEYWTTDIDPDCVKWGEPGRHVVCDVTEIDRHFDAQTFDVVVMNGLFSFGVDTPDDKEATGVAVHRILKRGGTLIVGWGPNPPNQDPNEVQSIRTLFTPGTSLQLEDEIVIKGPNHVFSCYTAI